MAEIEKRDICLKLYVSPSEKELINLKMLQAGTTNLSAYAKKMLIDGYIIRSDFFPFDCFFDFCENQKNNRKEKRLPGAKTPGHTKFDFGEMKLCTFSKFQKGV